MRSAELYEENAAASGKELSLGMGSLIGIFFGLAMVCGVFFGFGYMMGHRSPRLDASVPDSPKSTPAAPKPSAQILSQPAITPSPSAPSSATPDADESSTLETPAPTSPVIAAPPQPAATAETASSPSPAASGAIMVQIAAVKNQSDAEALAAALRKNGFTPAVRTEAQDKLLHVQIGPFANRDEAKTMRQKLSEAGYNAFIK